MKALSESRFLRFFVFGALYMAQGVPWGFIAGGYQIILTRNGYSAEAAGGVVALAYVPWSYKFLAGPLLDRFPSARLGRRRPYIVGAELLMGMTMFMLIFLDPKTQLSTITALLILHNICAALQDVAVDALAVDVLPVNELGRANGIMWAAKLGGSAFGNGGGIYLSKYFGWPALFVAMALLIWTIMLLPLFIRERPRDERRESTQERLNWREVRRSFTFAEPLVGIAIAFLTPVGYAIVDSFLVRMFDSVLKLNEARIGTLTGVVYLVSGVTGALAGGAAADRFGVRRTMGAAMMLIAGTIATFATMSHHWSSFAFVATWCAAFQFSVAIYGSASLRFFMTLCNPAVGATHFSLYMATTNLCYAASSWQGGRMVDHWTYIPTFYVAAVLQLVTIGLLFFCDPRKAAARFRTTEPAVSAAEGALQPGT